MQLFHRCVAVAVDQFRQDSDRIINISLSRGFDIGRCTLEYVVRHLALVARMTDADSYPFGFSFGVSMYRSV